LKTFLFPQVRDSVEQGLLWQLEEKQIPQEEAAFGVWLLALRQRRTILTLGEIDTLAVEIDRHTKEPITPEYWICATEYAEGFLSLPVKTSASPVRMH
jgi:hypothetical protein